MTDRIQFLESEVVRLQAEKAEVERERDSCEAELMLAGEILSASQTNAARYRFWRKLWCADDDCQAINNLPAVNSEDEWDAEIDAARQAEEGEKG